MASSTDSLLFPLLADPARLKREAVKRRKNFEERSIPPESTRSHEADGWIVDKQLKTKTRIKRERDIGERLENRFWMLLFKLGYPEMNEGRSFTIMVERKGAAPYKKQIDVFAKDEETVVVAECKASQKVTKRSLQKDVEEFCNLKGPIARAVNKHYGKGFKPKIIWLFVTENIIWSRPDLDRAAGGNIRVITQRELRYYSQIAEHLGKAARYQFLAEFLRDMAIPQLQNTTVPAICGKLGGRKFYCFVTTPRHLLKISFVNHRSLNDPDGAPTYQRLVSKSRIKDIGSYIVNGGYFPNNILVNFTRQLRFDRISHDESAGVTFGTLYLPDRYRSAWIIDGQHRIYGFSPIADKYLDQNIIVVAFENLSKAEEASLFVTINHEQKSVPKHLLDDLEGELKWGSTVPVERIGAIAARLINQLNLDVGEPFYNRITQQGIKSTNMTCLTMPALKEAIRKSGLVGRAVSNHAIYELGPLCGATDAETLDRARSGINQFFSVIRNANLGEWENGRESYLCTNVAVQAYLKLLSSLIRYWEANTAADSREMPVQDMLFELEEYLAPITDFLEGADAQSMSVHFRVPFGSGGPPEYYYRLCKMIKAKFADFQPEGMDEWETEQSEERIEEADRKLKLIVTEMRETIFDVFRVVYGEDKDAYWDKGVPDKQIKAKAYERSLDVEVEDRLPLESYLEVVEMKKIVENRGNWPHFKKLFNIPEPGEKGLAKNLKWMDRVNELRRIPAHPSRDRRYKVEDFEYIDFAFEEFMKRLQDYKKDPDLVPADSGDEVDG